MKDILNLQGTIFLLVAVGFFLRMSQIITKEGQRCITELVIDVVLPCNIIKAFCIEFGSSMGTELLITLGLSVMVQVISVIYGHLFFRRESRGHRKCLRYGMICSNAGFLGNPVAEGVYGPYGLLLASVFLIPQRIMMWTEGVAIFAGYTDRRAAIRRSVTHPCVVACLVGLVLLLTGWRFPEAVSKTIGYLGSSNTALSMLVIGMILGTMDPKALWNRTVAVYTAHRLVICPALIFGICYVLRVPAVVRNCVVLLTAMPAGATTSILAVKYDMEPEFATKMVVFSTLLSLPTLVIWTMLLK